MPAKSWWERNRDTFLKVLAILAGPEGRAGIAIAALTLAGYLIAPYPKPGIFGVGILLIIVGFVSSLFSSKSLYLRVMSAAEVTVGIVFAYKGSGLCFLC